MARNLGVVAGHGLVPVWTLECAEEHDLSPSDVVVFLALCLCAEPDRLSVVSAHKLAETTRLSRTTVKRSLTKLVTADFLIDLGSAGANRPRRFRVQTLRPAAPHSLGIPTTRAVHTGKGWLEAI